MSSETGIDEELSMKRTVLSTEKTQRGIDGRHLAVDTHLHHKATKRDTLSSIALDHSLFSSAKLSNLQAEVQ